MHLINKHSFFIALHGWKKQCRFMSVVCQSGPLSLTQGRSWMYAWMQPGAEKTSWQQEVPPDTSDWHRTDLARSCESSIFTPPPIFFPFSNSTTVFTILTSPTNISKLLTGTFWNIFQNLAMLLMHLLHTITSGWVDPNHHYSGQHNHTEFAEQKVKSFIIKEALYIVYTSPAYLICWHF